MELKDKVAVKMMEFYEGMPKYIQHFLKVERFCNIIGQGEGLDEAALELLSIAGYTHDIGIKPSKEKYGSSAGPNQEKEGPPVAREMLSAMGVDEDVIERVCYLIGHHHTYDNIDGIDYQILVEADFLVNIYEEEMDQAAIESVKKNIFRTKTGTMLVNTLFPGK